MKTCLTLFMLFTGIFSYGQSDRYQLDFNIDGGNELTKTVVKDYGTHQLICGTFGNIETTVFWFAKLSGDNVIWAKSIPARPYWASTIVSPTDIVQCDQNGDILFVARECGTMGEYSAKVLKVNAAGTLLWSREIFTLPGTYAQGVYENNPMIVEDDGVIISMAGTDYLQITKLNLNGNLVYSKQLRLHGALNTVNPGYLFIPNGSGGYVAGFDCDNSPAVVRLGQSFNVLWSNKFTIGGNAELRSICETESGNLLIGGPRQYPDVFVGMLDHSGNLQSCRKLNDSGFFSIDQLFTVDNTTILANGRQGYALIDVSDWSYDKIECPLPFKSFRKTNNGWSFGSAWSYDYYLDFNLMEPECIDYEGPVLQMSEAVAGTAEAITCTVSDAGTMNAFLVQLTDVPVSVTKGCYLSVPEESVEDFTVSPNPVSTGGMLSFEIAGDLWERVIFTDIRGNIVATLPFESHVTVPELNAGIYFVRLTGKSGDLPAKKIVIE